MFLAWFGAGQGKYEVEVKGSESVADVHFKLPVKTVDLDAFRNDLEQITFKYETK